MRKKKILKILFISISIIALVTLTGCSKTKQSEEKQNEGVSENNKSESNTENENVTYLKIDRTENFDGETAVVSETVNFSPVNYVIDKDFNVLCSYTDNSTYIDGFMQIEDSKNKKTNVVDVNGNVVFSYEDFEYKNVELVDDGCLIVTKQVDTYNSANITTGIYSLKDKKYVLEPNEKYVNAIRTYGDDMLIIDDSNTEFFNLKTKSIVKYSERVDREFKDGYSVDQDYDDNGFYLKVFDDNGNVKEIKSLFGDIDDIQYSANGMLFSAGLKIENVNLQEKITGCNIQVFNYEEGSVIDLSSKFYMVANRPVFTKDGYALISFENQGDTPYYTIIDKKGNFMFEPQKINENMAFQGDVNNETRKLVSGDLQEGNYFIVTDDGKYAVVDKDNNVVLTADENEEFEGITNNTVEVKCKEPGKYDEYYYKDFSGNKKGIKLQGDIKKIND